MERAGSGRTKTTLAMIEFFKILMVDNSGTLKQGTFD